MAEMDKVVIYSVKDTEPNGDRTKYAALIRAILDFTPKELKGFITCALRYRLTLKDGVVTECSRPLSHSVATEGYHDDDYTAVQGFPRLGNTDIMGTPDQKERFETLIKPWFEFVVLGLKKSRSGFEDLRYKAHPAFDVVRADNDPGRPERLAGLNKALTELVPEDLRKARAKLLMKVDVYTDRSVYGWHKDWNDGHALVVGLLNVSQHPLSSAELVFLEGDPTEDNLIKESKIRPSSPTRTAMRALVRKLKLKQGSNNFRVKNDHESGQIRWFNDVVWVHRTPPMNQKTEDVDNATFGLGGGFGTLPPFVRETKNAGDPTRYVRADAGSRMLLRVTIRDIYQPCTEVWYQRTEKPADRRMWFRVKGEKATKWKFRTGGVWYDIPANSLTPHRPSPIDPYTGDLYSLQSCDANLIFRQFNRDHWINYPKHTYSSFEFAYTDTSQVEHPVPPVAVPKNDIN